MLLLILLSFNKRAGGHSSVGRVQASQAWCREFESRCPLQLELECLSEVAWAVSGYFLWTETKGFLLIRS